MWRKLAQGQLLEVLLPAALPKRLLERCLMQRLLRWRKTSQMSRGRTQRKRPNRKIQKLKKSNLCRRTSKRFLFKKSIPCLTCLINYMFGKIFQLVGSYLDFFFNLGCVTSLKKLANWPVTWTLWTSLIKRLLLSSDDDTFSPVVPIFTFLAIGRLWDHLCKSTTSCFAIWLRWILGLLKLFFLNGSISNQTDWILTPLISRTPNSMNSQVSQLEKIVISGWKMQSFKRSLSKPSTRSKVTRMIWSRPANPP